MKTNCIRCGSDIIVDNKRKSNVICSSCLPTKEELYDLYIFQKISITKITKKYKLAFQTIRKLLVNYGIEIVSKRVEKIEFTRNCSIKLTLKQCKICGKYTKTINLICNKCLPNKEELLNLTFKNMTKIEIAKKYEISINTIKTLFKKYDIKKQKINIGVLKEITDYKDKNRYDGVEDIDYVVCKICGAKRQSLSSHVVRLHKISSKEYRKKYNVDKMICDTLKNKMSTKCSISVSKLYKEGKLKVVGWGENRKANKLEQKIDNSTPSNVIFTGGYKKGYQTLFFRLKNKNKNPDFVVIEDSEYLKELEELPWYKKSEKIAKDRKNKKIKINKFIEVCGLYWHSQKMENFSIPKYEEYMIELYASCNKKCLVIWDFEFEEFDKVLIKIDSFMKM